MSFGRAAMFHFLWVLPLLWIAFRYGESKRQKVLRDYAHPRALATLLPPGTRKSRRARTVLVLTAAMLLVAAMAGPRYGSQWQPPAPRGVDLIIALDCSRSMLARDVAPSRLDLAKRKIVDLLALLESDRVGLVAFAGSAFLQCPLTIDYEAVKLFVDELYPDRMPQGGTDLAAAIETALAAFDPHSTADKAIILLSDGEDTGRGDLDGAARQALATGVTLLSIGVGSTAGEPIPSGEGGWVRDRDGQVVFSRLDESRLSHLAAITGGRYVGATAGDSDVRALYREHILGVMTDAEWESGRKQVPSDRFQWTLLPAVLLLIAARALGSDSRALVLALLIPAVAAGAGPLHADPLRAGCKAYQQGRYEEALAHFGRGRENHPDNPAVLYNLGNTYYRTGDYDAARTYYRQGLSMAEPDLKAKLFYNLGNTAYRQGRWPEAVANYLEALALAPEDRQARENLAFVQQRMQIPVHGADQDTQPTSNMQPQPEESRDGTADGIFPGDIAADPRSQDFDASSFVADPQSSRAIEARRQPGAGTLEAPAQAAVHMLNRLQDAPGLLFVPATAPDQTDKDW